MSSLVDVYKYAKLATAAYIDLEGKPTSGESLAAQSHSQKRLPEFLANQTFSQKSDEAVGTKYSSWRIPNDGYQVNDSKGYAATVFQREGETVLAIRGTETGGSEQTSRSKINRSSFVFSHAMGVLTLHH